MSCFKFRQKEIASKDFHKQKKATDIFMSNVNKVVIYNKVSCNNEKDWQYIIGNQVDGETIISLFIKTPKNIFSYGISQYKKKLTYTISYKVSEVREWVLHYRNI